MRGGWVLSVSFALSKDPLGGRQIQTYKHLLKDDYKRFNQKKSIKIKECYAERNYYEKYAPTPPANALELVFARFFAFDEMQKSAFEAL